jgi:hypothetical protein
MYIKVRQTDAEAMNLGTGCADQYPPGFCITLPGLESRRLRDI